MPRIALVNSVKKHMNEKILNKTKVYQGTILDIELVDLDFGNGIFSTFEQIKFKASTSVSALAIDENENVILLSHFLLGAKKHLLTLPSGGLQAGENPQKRMNIELQEEVGYKAGKLELLYRSYALPGYLSTSPSYIFLATGLTESKLQGDEIETLKIVKLPLDSLIEMIKKGELQDNRTISALLYYDKFKRQTT